MAIINIQDKKKEYDKKEFWKHQDLSLYKLRKNLSWNISLHRRIRANLSLMWIAIFFQWICLILDMFVFSNHPFYWISLVFFGIVLLTAIANIRLFRWRR